MEVNSFQIFVTVRIGQSWS